MDSEQKSRQGDSVRGSDRNVQVKEAVHSGIRDLVRKEKDISLFAHLLVPLEVEPPREIPDAEKILRDRKEKQIKMREMVRTQHPFALIV